MPHPSRPPRLLGTQVLRRTAANFAAGRRVHVTCLRPMEQFYCYFPDRMPQFYLWMLGRIDEEAAAAGDVLVPQLIAETRAMVSAETVTEKTWAMGSALYGRIYDLQPGRKRIWVRATRRKAENRHLLVCEDILWSFFRLWKGYAQKGETLPGTFLAGDAVRYYVATWRNMRLLMNQDAITRVLAIADWWDRVRQEEE